jgi:hypothetical protein
VKGTIKEQVFRVSFRWTTDEDGDLQLYAKVDGGKKEYWGMVCPHHGKDDFRIVADDRNIYALGSTLKEAKEAAEIWATQDLARDGAEICIE